MRLLLMVLLAALQTQTAAWAGQKGNGGDGLALLFTEMGRRIHRESLMEPFQHNRLQLRDKVPMEAFYAATLQTRIVITDERVVDNQGEEVTATFLTADEARALWVQRGISPQEIANRLREYPRGVIEVSRSRFVQELNLGWGLALKTVFHEYGRAMGIDETAYRYSADPEVAGFFQRLYDQSTPVTKQVLSDARAGLETLESKLELITREVSRLRSVMAENRGDLIAALAVRGQRIEEQRRAFTAYGHAFADVLDSMGVVPMPFPSYSARIFRKQVDAQAEGMLLEQKLSETAVLDQQVRFLNSRLNQDADYFLKLEDARQRLIVKVLE